MQDRIEQPFLPRKWDELYMVIKEAMTGLRWVLPKCSCCPNNLSTIHDQTPLCVVSSVGLLLLVVDAVVTLASSFFDSLMSDFLKRDNLLFPYPTLHRFEFFFRHSVTCREVSYIKTNPRRLICLSPQKHWKSK